MTAKATAPAVRAFLISYLEQLAERLGVTDLQFGDETRLLDTGVVDSVGFIELVLATEDEFGTSVDLDRHDPAEFTTLGGLVRAVIASRPAS